jgi:ABC-type transporter Mla subunit MlaD
MSITEKEIKDALDSLNKMKEIVDKYDNKIKENLTEEKVTIETLNNNMDNLQSILKKLNNI